MKKFLIICAGLVVVVIVLAAGLAALSPVFLNKYKKPILTKVGETIHRDVHLGDIRLTLLTGVGLRLTDLTVANGKGFRQEPMLAMKGLDLKVKVFPLLRKKLEVERVILQEPRILIEKDNKGRFNFSDLTGGTSSKPAGETRASSSSPPAALAALLVSQVKISNGQLSYYESGPNFPPEGVQIQDLNLELENLSLDKAIPIVLSFGLNRNAEDVKLSGTIGPVGKKLEVEAIPLSLQMAIHDFDLARVMPFLGKTPPVKIEKGKLELTTDLAGDLGTGLSISSETRVSGLSVTDPERKEPLVRDLSMAVQKEILLALKEDSLTIKRTEVKVGPATLRLTGKVTTLRNDPSLSLQMESEAIPLAGWDKVFPALAGIGLDGSVKTDGTVTGKPAEKMQIVLNLTSPKLVVKLPKKGKTPSAGAKTSWRWVPMVEAAESKAPSPKKEKASPLPENIDLRGKVEIAKGMIDNVSFSDFKANYAKKGDRIGLSDLTAHGFGEQGAVQGAAEIDFAPSQPTYQARFQVSRVDLAVLQEALASREEKVGGTLNADLSITGAGLTMDKIEKTLTGGGSFKVEQGVLQNVNLEEKILEAVAAKFGLPVATVAQMAGVEISPGNKTSFDELNGAFRIGEGSIHVENATITSANHGFFTRGTVGLNQKLNLSARMILRKVGEASGKKFTYYLLDEQKRKYIPFKVTGNASSPKVAVDVDALIKGQARQVIEKKKEKLKERLKEKVGPGGEEILKPFEKLLNF
jgi:AsmA protein